MAGRKLLFGNNVKLVKEMDFDGWSEADVREEILAPLVRKLGYRKGSENNVSRETTLRYDRNFLGRKKPKSDPKLRGHPDYICEVRGIGRWVIEAKSPLSVVSDIPCK
jgi:hypothetical protein